MANIPAVFTVPELARLLGLHKDRVRRLLAAHQIPVDRTMGVHRVWLSDLQASAPQMWDSLVLSAAARGERLFLRSQAGDDLY